MKNLIPFFALFIFAACQSQFHSADPLHNNDVEVKLATSRLFDTAPAFSHKTQDDWYSELSEIKGFENYEEENGIILNKHLSLATYFNLNNPSQKLIILEKIKNRPNGEVLFRKLSDVTIQLQSNQFLTTDFCTLNNDDNVKIITLYETTNDANKMIKAWKINQKTLELNSIATKHVKCMLDI